MNRDVRTPGLRSRVAFATLFGVALATLRATARAADVAPSASPAPPAALETIPAGTRIRFSLLEPVSSQTSVSGSRVSFKMLDPIALGGRTIVSQNAVGLGTLVLAGHAGAQGHEGDLTISVDSIRTPSGALVTFGPERYRINGRNRKVAATLLGFVPYAGLGAHYIRGSDIVLGAGEPVSEGLQHPATVSDVATIDATPSAPPSASPPPAPVPAAT